MKSAKTGPPLFGGFKNSGDGKTSLGYRHRCDGGTPPIPPTSGSAAKIFKSQLMGRFGAKRRTGFLELTLPLFAFFKENSQLTLPLLRFFGLFQGRFSHDGKI